MMFSSKRHNLTAIIYAIFYSGLSLDQFYFVMLFESWRRCEKWDIRQESKCLRTGKTYVKQYVSQLSCLWRCFEKVDGCLKNETYAGNPNFRGQERHTSDNPFFNQFLFIKNSCFVKQLILLSWQMFEKGIQTLEDTKDTCHSIHL